MRREVELSQKPTIQEFQKYVAQIVVERGFDYEDITGQFMQFVEEVGEFAKVIRKNQNMNIDQNSHVGGLSEELADMFIYILYFANYFKIDLEKAFRQKEAINKQRVWKKSK